MKVKYSLSLISVITVVILLDQFVLALDFDEQTNGESHVMSMGKMQNSDIAERFKKATNNIKVNTSTILENNDNVAETNKEVHKRGVVHYGIDASGGDFGHFPVAPHWPKTLQTFANPQGYSIEHLPVGSQFAVSNIVGQNPIHHTSILKYPISSNIPFQYRTGIPVLPATRSPFLPAAIPVSSTNIGLAHHALAAPLSIPRFVLRPGGAVVNSYNVQYPQLPTTSLSYNPVQHVAAPTDIQPIIPTQHVHSVQPVIPVQGGVVEPTTPVLPQLPIHTQFVQHTNPPLHAIPQFPSPAAVFPSFPTFPSVDVTAQSSPPITHVLSIQPTTHQKPTVVRPILPTPRVQQRPLNGQFPVEPVASFPCPQIPSITSSNADVPQFGHENASPSIPAPTTLPELPMIDHTQEPWRPMVYDTPSKTLQPPYGGSTNSSPAQGYLPPVTPIANNLFDNLNDAEIDHVIRNAKLSARLENHRNNFIYNNHGS